MLLFYITNFKPYHLIQIQNPQPHKISFLLLLNRITKTIHMPEKKLSGQTAIVTGASSGIGKATAIALGSAGANVVVNYHSKSKDEIVLQVCDQIRSFGVEAVSFRGDVSKEDEVFAMFEETYKHFSTLDILINNAGIELNSPFAEMTLADWQRVIDVNLTGHFLCAREAVKEFLKRGVVPERSQAAGKIIFMSSVHDRIPWAGHVNYAASKGGIMMLMQSISQELAPKKIRVNSVSPGAIKTPINKNAWSDAEAKEDLLELIPYKRVGEPADVARAVVWLASDDSDYVNGTTLYVDGGMMLYPSFAHGG